MVTNLDKDDDSLTDEETAKRRDDILKRMHKLPPKPNKDYVGDSKKKPTKKKSRD